MANKSDPFGAEGYRRGALERLQEALVLLRAERFAGSAYLAGRSVEGMLRGQVHKRRTLKQASAEFFTSCSSIISRCEEIYASTD